MNPQNELAMVFEISRGCQHACSGCQVNKDSGGIPSDEVLTNLLGLLYDLKSSGVRLAEIELGPTDLNSAINRDEIFTHPLVGEIVRAFSHTVLNAAFIHPESERYVRLAQQVSALSPHNPVGLVMPLEMKHVFNEKYIERIRQNVETFREHLSVKFTEVIFSIVVDHHSLMMPGNKHTYEKLFARARELRVSENTAIDFAFHQGRSGLGSQWNRSDLLQSIQNLNAQYLQDLSKRLQVERRHLPSHVMFDQEIPELLFHQAGLYVRPIINERITVIDELMKVSGPWTAENIMKRFEDRIQDNLDLVHQTGTDCSSCTHLEKCANRSIPQLMQLLDTRDCITLLRSYGEQFGEKDASHGNL